MRPAFSTIIVCGVLAGGLLAAAQRQEGKIAFTVYDGHFEKNNAGLPGDESFLLLKDQDQFDKVFGTLPPLMNENPKKARLPKGTFADKLVVAVIKRGNGITKYSEVNVTLKGDTVVVSYQAKMIAITGAKFASPLIVAVPKENVEKAIFIENGKEIGTAK